MWNLWIIWYNEKKMNKHGCEGNKPWNYENIVNFYCMLFF